MPTLKLVPDSPGPIRYPTDEDAHIVDLMLINTTNEAVAVPCKLLMMRGLDIRYISCITGSHVDGRFSLTDPALGRQLEMIEPGRGCRIPLTLDREAIEMVRTQRTETIEARVKIPPIPELQGISASIVLDILWSD